MSDVKREWITSAGLRAVVRGSSRLSHLCGYVGLPSTHPLHGVGYSEPHPALTERWNHIREHENIGKRGIVPIFCMSHKDQPGGDVVFDVHGSLTYAGGSATYPVESHGLWWFGFDAGHCDDTPEVQDVAYMSSECESLARQLAEIVPIIADSKVSR